MRLAMALLMPAAMSSTGTPSFRCWITSAWAQTVQADARMTGFLARADSSPSSSSLTPSTRAITSRNRARAGGALVIGDELHHVPIAVQSYGLAVLPADVDDGPHRRDQPPGALAVAGDLGDRLVHEGYLVPAVAGPHAVRHVARGEPRPRAGHVHDLLRGLPGLRLRLDEGVPEHLPALHDHRLGGQRPDVAPADDHGSSLLTLRNSSNRSRVASHDWTRSSKASAYMM